MSHRRSKYIALSYLILNNFRGYLISRKFGSCICQVLIFAIPGKKLNKNVINFAIKSMFTVEQEEIDDCTKKVFADLKAAKDNNESENRIGIGRG